MADSIEDMQARLNDLLANMEKVTETLTDAAAKSQEATRVVLDLQEEYDAKMEVARKAQNEAREQQNAAADNQHGREELSSDRGFRHGASKSTTSATLRSLELMFRCSAFTAFRLTRSRILFCELLNNRIMPPIPAKFSISETVSTG